MNGYKVVVNKSTVPVGTAAKVRDVIRRETTHPFSVVSNPEFLKQGAAIDDFMKPDRVVIGAEDPRAAELMKELYSPFTRTGAPIMMMDCASAELCKYAANAMLATRISFMNEVANVCEAVGANVDQVRHAVASDRRIGPSFLFPGVGYGGSCFPKDVKAMMRFAEDKDYDFQILRAVEAVNEEQKRLLVTKMEEHFGSLKGKRIAIWGLAFKPKTDDMREAPAVPLIQGLLAAGATVTPTIPEAMKVAQEDFRLEDSVRRQQLCGADRRRRAGDRDGVERVPRAGLRAHAQADAPAGHLRRPQHLQPREPAGAGLHATSRWGVRERRPRHRRRRLHRQPCRQGAAGARRDRHRLRQLSARGIGRPRASRPAWSKATSTTRPLAAVPSRRTRSTR